MIEPELRNWLHRALDAIIDQTPVVVNSPARQTETLMGLLFEPGLGDGANWVVLDSGGNDRPAEDYTLPRPSQGERCGYRTETWANGVQVRISSCDLRVRHEGPHRTGEVDQ